MTAFNIITLVAAVFTGLARAQWVQEKWIMPAAPDNTTKLTNGKRITISWAEDLVDAFVQYCPSCDTANMDLWASVAPPVLVGKGISISMLEIEWEVSVDESALEAAIGGEQLWRFQFAPTGEPPSDGDEVSSPYFFIRPADSDESDTATTSRQPSTSFTRTTVTQPAETTDTASDDTVSGSSRPSSIPLPTTSPSSADIPTGGSSSLTTAAKAGIGVGGGVGAVVFFAIGFVLARRQRRKKTSQYTPPARSMTASSTKQPETPRCKSGLRSDCTMVSGGSGCPGPRA